MGNSTLSVLAQGHIATRSPMTVTRQFNAHPDSLHVGGRCSTIIDVVTSFFKRKRGYGKAISQFGTQICRWRMKRDGDHSIVMEGGR